MSVIPELGIELPYKQNTLICDRLIGNSPGVVYFGGYSSTRHAEKAEALWRWSVKERASCLRFDYSGHGESTGEFVEGTLGLWLEEALHVVEKLGKGPQVVVGSSMGGWLALLAARERPDLIGAVITVACAADFTEQVVRPELTEEALAELKTRGWCEEVERADGPPRIVSRKFLEEASNHLLLGGPIKVDCPVTMLHGLGDDSIPWHTSLEAANLISSTEVSLELIPGGDHRLSSPRDLAKLLRRVEEVRGLLRG